MNSEMILTLLTERQRMAEMINAIDVLVAFYGPPVGSRSPLDAVSKDITKWAVSVDKPDMRVTGTSIFEPDRRVAPAESSP